MKTLDETIDYLAQAMFHKYMSGSNDFRVDGMDTAAWIFGLKYEHMSEAVDEKFQEFLDNNGIVI